MNKSIEITKAIKQGCWLQIQYNKPERDKYFWFAITNIDVKRKILYGDFHNIRGNTDGMIYFDKIINAKVIRNSYYDVPKELINNISMNVDILDWLDFDDKSVSLIEYYRECYYNDVDASAKHFDMIKGIDNDFLNRKLNESNDGKYELTLTQLDELKKLLGIKAFIKDEDEIEIKDLGLNIFSLSTKDSVYPVAYKLVRFNPKDLTLKLDNKIVMVNSLTIKGKKVNLTSLIDYPEIESLSKYVISHDKTSEINELSEDIKKAIQLKVGMNVKQDERPYLLILEKELKTSINPELTSIIEMYKNQTLSTPLKAFFGTITARNQRRKNYPIALYDNNVNIDQLRVINSAMKNAVTYVQGPPGTGKTYTILNILVSAFYNERTALVSSNNNKPVNDIYKKLGTLKYNKESIPFPIIRLGNNKLVKEALVKIKKLYYKYKDFKIPPIDFKKIKENQEKDLKTLNHLLDEEEKRVAIEEKLEALDGFFTIMKESMSTRSIEFDLRHQDLKNELNKYHVLANKDIIKYVVVNKEFGEWLYYLSILFIQRLKETKYEKLQIILDSDLENEEVLKTSVTSFNEYLRNDANLRDFLRVFPIVISTNLSITKLGSAKVQFDLVIIDEAGQCSIAGSFPPLVRGDSLVLVGDTNQLNPVVVLDKEINRFLREHYNVGCFYDYCENSILKTMSNVDAISKYILLKKHYRSVKDIIAFSNRKYYGEKLDYARVDASNTDPLQFIDVSSRGSDIGEKNTSIREAEAIVSSIKKNNYNNVGIITPFKNQSDIIRGLMKENGLNDIVEVGTIHSFQGGEKDVIYVSLGITPFSKEGTFKWVKNNKELINVGVTRAKNSLILVGDSKEVEKRSKAVNNDLYELVQYVKTKGKSIVNESDDPNVVNSSRGLKRLNTTAEKEFLKTLVQIMSIDEKYIVKEKVKVSSVIKECQIEDMNYYLQSEFDFVIYDKNDYPVLAIELNGLEHTYDKNVIIRDKKKRDLAKNKIELIEIPNDFTRKYQYIKNYISTII